MRALVSVRERHVFRMRRQGMSWFSKREGGGLRGGGGWFFFGRSPAVVVAYLMRHGNLSLAESYKWVKDRRPSISITSGDAICRVDCRKI